jgi:hypothetical protein
MVKSIIELDGNEIRIIVPDATITYSCRKGRNAIDDHIDDLKKELEIITKKNLWTAEEKAAKVKESVEIELNKMKSVNELMKCLQTELVNSIHSVPYKLLSQDKR